MEEAMKLFVKGVIVMDLLIAFGGIVYLLYMVFCGIKDLIKSR